MLIKSFAFITAAMLATNVSGAILKCTTLDNPIIPDKYIEITKKNIFVLMGDDQTKRLDKYNLEDKGSYYLAFKKGEYGVDSIKINKYDLKMLLIGHVDSGEAVFNYQCKKVEKLIL